MLKTIEAVLRRIEELRGGSAGELAFELDGVSPDDFRRVFDELVSLTTLESLTIGAACLPSDGFTPIDERLWGLSQLRSLELSADISELPPGIERLSRLEKLALTGYSEAPYPVDIFKLSELRSLEVRMAQEHDGKPIEEEKGEWHIGRLEKLEELVLDENADLYCLPKTIVQCKRLRRVSLSNSGMKEKFPDGFADLPLEELDVENSGAMAWLTDELRNKPGLRIHGER